MFRRLLVALFFAFALGPPLFAQAKAGPFTINSSTSPCATITVTGNSTVGITVTGTFSATLQPEVAMVSRDGTNAGSPQNTQVTPSTSTTAQSTITAAGVYKGAVGGFDTFLVCVTSFVSGSATIYLNTTTAVNASLFGSGATPGTVTVSGVPTNGDCTKFTGSTVVADAGFPCMAPSGVPTQPVQNGLIAEYRILPTETAGALVDYSGNGNGATGTVGTAPTIIAGSGGLNFTGNGAVSLPAALNAGVTFQFVIGFQFAGAGQYNAMIAGGPSAPTNCTQFFLDDQHNNVNAGTNYIFETWKTNFRNFWRYTVQGSALVTWEIGNGGTDQFALNNQTLQTSGQDTGLLNAGNYQLGGWTGGGGSCPSVSTYFTGKIYYVLVYSRQLTQAEVNSNNEFLQDVLAARGLNIALASTSTTDTFLLDGDSEIGFITNAMMNFPATVNVYNLSASGYTMETLTSDAPNAVDPYYQTAANREAVLIWGGTNDSGGSFTTTLNYLNGYCRARHLRGFKCGVMTMMDRSASDTFKNNYDTAIRTSWPVFADFLVDAGEDPNLGCDGCSANTTYMSTGLHPTTASANNILAQFMQRGLNRAYGHLNWTTATTYTTGAPAATAITAASEATNTVTITSTLNPPVGSCVVVAGVTPAGYNNVAGECWNVLTTSATNFTYFNFTSGLGAGTIFGTAAVPRQLDADVYTILAGSATSPSFTLEPCGGYTGQNIYLKNENTTSPWVITPFASETIDGAASLTMPTASSGNFPVVVLQSQLVSSSAGGCNWVRLQ